MNMRILAVLAVSVLLVTPVMGADSYVPVTPDNEVETVGQVKVIRLMSIPMQQPYTLNVIDAQLADYANQISRIEQEMSDLTEIRGKVAPEAAKVKLYVAPAEPDVIE